jgi:hypothetical protein
MRLARHLMPAFTNNYVVTNQHTTDHGVRMR